MPVRTTVADWLATHLRTGGPDECWFSDKRPGPDGYVEFEAGGRRYKLHRLLLEARLGRPLARGTCACHSCDVKACANPAHLWEGTRQQNNADRDAKGRTARGENSAPRRHPASYWDRGQHFRAGSPMRHDGDKHWTRLDPERAAAHMARARDARWRAR